MTHFQYASYVFGQISQNADANNANYNALQLTLTRQFSHGFSLLASYVWSKSQDFIYTYPANITLTLSDQTAGHFRNGSRS